MSNLDTLRQIIIHLEIVSDLIHTFTGALYRREKSALVSLSKPLDS